MEHSTAALDYSDRLLHLMQQVGLSNFKALSVAAGVSEQQIRHLRRGKMAQMRLAVLGQISQVLQVAIADLVAQFSESWQPEPLKSNVQARGSAADLEVESLKQEYDRLQARLDQQHQDLLQEFQQSSLQILESLVLQLPTAAYAAQQNPQAPAVKLLPLLRPIDTLLNHWGIVAIAAVGSEIPYDPQQHQLMDGTVEVGDRVRVRYTGYRQGEKLLYRAKVSPG